MLPENLGCYLQSFLSVPVVIFALYFYIVSSFIFSLFSTNNIIQDKKNAWQALLIITTLCTIAFVIIPMLADQVYHIDMDKPLEYENDTIEHSYYDFT